MRLCIVGFFPVDIIANQIYNQLYQERIVTSISDDEGK